MLILSSNMCIIIMHDINLEHLKYIANHKIIVIIK